MQLSCIPLYRKAHKAQKQDQTREHSIEEKPSITTTIAAVAIAIATVAQVVSQMQQQLSNEDFAVLYRTNSQSRAMEEALRKIGIPYRIVGGMSFYQRKEIKDLLAYLRLTVNPNDEQALRRDIAGRTSHRWADGRLRLKAECERRYQ